MGVRHLLGNFAQVEMIMHFNETVQKALRHANQHFPEVTQVFYGADGRWLYCDESFNAPNFGDKVDTWLLEDAADAAGNDKGFPCAYRLLGLADYAQWWESFFPVAKGKNGESDLLLYPFLHFTAGTPRDEIVIWFEAQKSQAIKNP